MKKDGKKIEQKKKIIISAFFVLLLVFSFFGFLNLNRYFSAKKIELKMNQVITKILAEKPLVVKEENESTGENYYLTDLYGNGRASGLFQDNLFLEKAFKLEDSAVFDYQVAGADRKFMLRQKTLPNGTFYYATDVSLEKAREKTVGSVFLVSFVIALLFFYWIKKRVLLKGFKV